MAVEDLIAEDIAEISTRELKKALHEEIIDKSAIYKELKKLIPEFMKQVKQYQMKYMELKSMSFSDRWEAQEKLLKFEIDNIYSVFFQIQNLFNAYVNQKIIMTYVSVDGDGNRTIKVSNNNIDLLSIEQFTYPYKFQKLGYNFNNSEHATILKNCLPDKDNATLNTTAKEVTKRYNDHKIGQRRHLIMWNTNGKWSGYSLNTKGPINEAYVNFYVHNVKLKSTLEYNIERFMIDDRYGVKKADATKGFMIGDVRSGGIQYAVKGEFGSPQHFKDVYNTFEKLLGSDGSGLSPENIDKIIDKYLIEERQRNYAPQAKELVSDEITKLLEKFSKM